MDRLPAPLAALSILFLKTEVRFQSSEKKATRGGFLAAKADLEHEAHAHRSASTTNREIGRITI